MCLQKQNKQKQTQKNKALEIKQTQQKQQ